MLNLDSNTGQHGCPQCGRPTWGMPTDTGFIWATCDACLERMNREVLSQSSASAPSSSASTTDPSEPNTLFL